VDQFSGSTAGPAATCVSLIAVPVGGRTLPVEGPQSSRKCLTGLGGRPHYMRAF
jgi:hypothetical protein